MTEQFNPKVSIIIPVYNGSNYLKEAIDSALAQTYKNIEIIVVNDGSSDSGETEKIAKSYGKKIRYFYKENGGTSTALNLGIKNMKGTYVSWLSHDDQYYPKKIERQIEELSKLDDKNTIMMTDLDGIDEKYRKIYETDYIKHIEKYPLRAKSYLHPIIYNQTHGCTLLIPKVCFDDVGLFDEEQKVAQDFELFYRVFKKYPHKLIPEVLVTARESSNRQGQRKKELCNIEYSNLYIKMIKELSDKEIKLLTPTKLDFYTDMFEFFTDAGYTYAYDFLSKKVIRNLQISSYDLIGNKFNGHDLHLYLREQLIDSKQLVLYKESKDPNTFEFDFLSKDATKNLLLQKIFYETDILHLHLVHNIIDLNYLPIITQLKPTIITLHDPFFLAGHCVHHFDCDKWKTHCKDCPYLDTVFPIEKDYSSLNFELKKQAIQNSQISAIVASKWLEKKVKQSPIWAGKKIYLLPFGIDQNLFKPEDSVKVRRELGISKGDLVLMCRINDGPFKGLDIIKEALSKIKSKKPITLITVDQKGHLDEYKKKLNIIEYDWIKDDKLLVSLYQACDIFLMPSRQETFGMMAVESMSCGKMVLSINGEGTALPEVIDSPNCGLSVEEKEFSKELQRLINHPKEIELRGRKSYEFAKKMYSKDRYIKKMLDIYKDVMKEHVLNQEAELILQQLKKYMPMEVKNTNQQNIGITILNHIFPDGSFLRRTYRRIIPRDVRQKQKNQVIGTLHIFKNIVPMKIRRVLRKLVGG